MNITSVHHELLEILVCSRLEPEVFRSFEVSRSVIAIAFSKMKIFFEIWGTWADDVRCNTFMAIKKFLCHNEALILLFGAFYVS